MQTIRRSAGELNARLADLLDFSKMDAGVVDLRQRGATLQCEVVDTGIGIAADETRRLFQPFAQAAATMRSHAGSGLGLAICKRLVEQMGGRIGVESTPGSGSIFWFTVPLTR